MCSLISKSHCHLGLGKLPYSIRILLESAIRNCDNFQVTKEDVEKIIDWENTSTKQVEIPFKPARVLLQDFTGVPAVVDLACMRDAMNKLGSDSNKINPLVPVDLVVDHSVQVDVAGSENAVQANMELEFQRNKERFAFLKWGSTAFRNMLVVPPGSGIVHQVNLEYLGRVVFNNEGLLYPDSVVGTDSHTTMIDGLGVAGWGVGGIEAEAAMLGQPMSMVLPGVVGFKLSGNLRNGVTATDLVLTVTQILRKHGVVGKFVEFYGDGMSKLSLADRATIANMSPEYGATMGFFPVDHVTLQYLKLTGRSDETVAMIESYLRANRLFVDYNEPQQDRVYSSYLELNLSDVEPCISGPKRPHDRVPLKEMKADWHACLDNKVGFKFFKTLSWYLINSKDVKSLPPLQTSKIEYGIVRVKMSGRLKVVFFLHRWTRNAEDGVFPDIESWSSSQELKSLMLWSLRETASKYIDAGASSIEKLFL